MNRPAETVPTSYETAGFRLTVASKYAQRIQDEGWTSKAAYLEAIAKARCVTGGRSPHRILEASDDPDERIRVRPCRHGGALGRVLGDRWLSSRRSFREFSIWTELHARGVPLPAPVFAVSQREGPFWISAFASREEPNMRDGLACLEAAPEPPLLDAFCISFAKALRTFHDAGGVHGDLQIRNILIGFKDGHRRQAWVQPPTCFFIDLDRTRLIQRVSPRKRIRELFRLLRSLEKTGHSQLTSRRFCALTLAAYCAGDRPLRRSMLRWARFESIGIWRHRIAWRLAGRFRIGRRLFAKPTQVTKSLR